MTSDRLPHGVRGDHLSLAYGSDEVVRDASITLPVAQVTALVGPNGSGKSTLLRSLARLHAPRAGRILLDDGTDVSTLTRPEFARTITLLAQSRPTPGGITVHDVVEFGRHPHRGRFRSADPEGAAAVAHAMQVTGVAEFADRPVDRLSGGQLQRVWLASCLAQETGVLLLDEPTTYLDLRYQVEILDLVRELADDHAVTIGVVLHDLDQAAAVADQLVLLSRGDVVASGAPTDVLDSERLTEVYGIRIDVDIDPLTGGIRTRAIGRHHIRPERTPAA